MDRPVLGGRPVDRFGHDVGRRAAFHLRPERARQPANCLGVIGHRRGRRALEDPWLLGRLDSRGRDLRGIGRHQAVGKGGRRTDMI